MFEKLKLLEFDGARRNYLTFKLEWKETSGYSGYLPELEVRELRKKLPKEVQADVKVMRTTAQIWTFLNQKHPGEHLGKLPNLQGSKDRV